ncbi:phage holin family protein [Mangrovimonas sp. DI 80]|uniref:phage holin family protein n=1 Tax=Mangrovimonas sp. DI 80 TaxID=1779330 RepID=UPI0009784D8A|nr:phage holin family protein [Mangrovimonas sp. DI 80]OMP29949.1 hypothetical protein BKM32_15205 [Mangrovimonas sp. DI 80]
MNKREQIKNWFYYSETSIGMLILAGIMAIFALFGLFALLSGNFSFGILVGLIIFAGVPAFIFYNYSRKNTLPTESQLDNWLDEDIQAIIKDRPFNKLGISKEDLVAESMLVVGPIYWYVNGFDQNDILAKEGKDGFNRFTAWTVQLFMFTENYLCSYKCDYNWLKNTYINESTNEFFYKDVVSVKTDTISSAHTLKDGQQMVHSEAFQLKLMGDEVTVITNDASLKTSSTMTSKAEKAVQSIRVMLRDKKS